MAVLIGHASIDENGKVQGKKPGDQTGKEICIRNWYSKPWNVYLECLDDDLADRAAAIMEEICKDDNFGYSQPNRWQGYQSILKNGRKVAGAKGDFDCSSLVLGCYILAGLAIAASGYTGNMKKILISTGKFKAYTDTAHVKTSTYAKRGGIYLKEGSHVVMALNNGLKASETIPGSGSGSKDSVHDKTADKLSVDGYWGKKTTLRLQKIFGTTEDGVVSNQHRCYQSQNPGLDSGWDWKEDPARYSVLIKAIQKKVGATTDGHIGPKTIKSIQKWMGTTQDGCFSEKSPCIKKLQQWCNNQ